MKKNFSLVLIFCFTKILSAQILENELHIGSDGLGNHLFATNPAIIYAQQKTDMAILGLQKSNSVTTDAPVTGQGNIHQNIEAVEKALGAAVVTGFGRGINLGINFEAIDRVNSGRHTLGRFDGELDHEEQKFFKFILTFSPFESVKIGTLVRLSTISADISGSYWLPETDRISYSGQTTGEGMGILFGSAQNGFSVAHITPMRGKIKINHESVLISEHGVYLAEFHFLPTSSLGIGFGARYYPQQLDSGNRWRDGRNQTRELYKDRRYFPRGIYHEEDIYSLAAGVSKKVSGGFVLKGGYSHTYLYSFIPFVGWDVGSTFVRRNKIKLRLGGESRQVKWDLGAAIGKANGNFSGKDGIATYSSLEHVYSAEISF